MVFRWSLVHIRDLASNECHPVVIFYLRTWQYFTFILPPFCSLPSLVNSLNLILLFPAKISSTPLWLGSLKSVHIPSQTTWSIEVWLENREYNDEQRSSILTGTANVCGTFTVTNRASLLLAFCVALPRNSRPTCIHYIHTNFILIQHTFVYLLYLNLLPLFFLSNHRNTSRETKTKILKIRPIAKYLWSFAWLPIAMQHVMGTCIALLFRYVATAQVKVNRVMRLLADIGRIQRNSNLKIYM